jgi:ATP-dependent DNA helicase PIF1
MANGKFKGKLHLIPRIPIIPSALKLPIVLQRIQFPLRSAFSMTVNKSQGCTFNFVGIYLNEALFSHGQLYVAMSRVSSMDNLYIATNSDPESVSRNVVYKEVFNSSHITDNIFT